MNNRGHCHLFAWILSFAMTLCLVLSMPHIAWAEEALLADELPEVSATAALLYDTDTNYVIFDQASEERRYPASLTKVMTALLVLEKGGLDTMFTVTEADFEHITSASTMSGFMVGEEVSVKDLLAGLLVPSGNDAAYTLARYVSGDWETFVEAMNTRASQLGCANTHFANPCGLHEDSHYTTASDLARIFNQALTHEEFLEIASSSGWRVGQTNLQQTRVIEPTNLMVQSDSVVYDQSVKAAKTGYTIEAGKCLIAYATRGDMNLVGVVLGDANETDANGVTPNFYDMKTLFDWGFGTWKTEVIISPGDVLGSLSVLNSKDGAAVDGASATELFVTIPRSTTLSDLTFDGPWDTQIEAPLEQGENVGTSYVYLGERTLGVVEVVSTAEMRLSIWRFILSWLSDPIHFGSALVVLVAVIGCIWLGWYTFHNHGRKNVRGAHFRR